MVHQMKIVDIYRYIEKKSSFFFLTMNQNDPQVCIIIYN